MKLPSNHISLTAANDIKNLISPLSSLGINYYSWDRHYNDGSRVNLCSVAEDLEYYYANKLYTRGNTEAKPSSYQSQIVLWSTLPNQSVFEFIKQRGIGNGIFIIEPHKDYCEFTGFAVNTQSEESINTFLTNMEYLKKFREGFKENANHIIKQAEKSKIYLPYHDKTLSRINNLNSSTDNDHAGINVKLSPRQYTCAKLLLEGKTTREIAQTLSLSSRTIESYINNLKLKLNCDNKTQLIMNLIKLLKVNA